MGNHLRVFPAVSDEEVIVTAPVEMHLYDERDLISNIHGPYQERFVESEPQAAALPTDTGSPTAMMLEDYQPLGTTPLPQMTRRERYQKQESSPSPQKVEKTMGQLAREASRRDILRKKQAAYLQEDRPSHRKELPTTAIPTPPRFKKAPLSQSDPTARVLSEEEGQEWRRLSEPLQQTSYILADLPPVYELEASKRGQTATRPTQNFDFLKKSQVYNHQERLQHARKPLAQELNLTQIGEG